MTHWSQDDGLTDVTAAFKGLTTPIAELIDDIHRRGWTLQKVDIKNGEYRAVAKSPHKETLEATGRTEATAVGNVLIRVMRREHMRASSLRAKLGAWDPMPIEQQFSDIAQAYAGAPVYEPKAAPAWMELAQDCGRRAQIIRMQLAVEFTDDPVPYESADELREDVTKKRHIFVTRAYAHHPVWSEQQMLDYRLVVDVLGHTIGGGDWGWHGTCLAFAQLAPLLAESAQKALFTELLGQAAFGQFYRQWGAQKICFLEDLIEKEQTKENKPGHSGVHPSQSIVPAAIPSIFSRVSAQTRTQLLRLKQELEKNWPDQSETIHDFPDGWSVRSPTTYGDIHRTGELMSNCLSLNSEACAGPYDHHPDWPRDENDDPLDSAENLKPDQRNRLMANLNRPVDRTWEHFLHDADGLPRAVWQELSGFGGVDNVLGRHNSMPKPEYLARISDYAQQKGMPPVGLDNVHEDLEDYPDPTDWEEPHQRTSAEQTQDPNANWESGVSPLQDAAYLWQRQDGVDPLDYQGLVDNLHPLESGVANMHPELAKQSVVNALRSSLMGTRNNAMGHAIHYQTLANIPANVDDPIAYWDALEQEREHWNQARGYAPGAHKQYWPEEQKLQQWVKAANPHLDDGDIHRQTRRELLHMLAEEEERVLAQDQGEQLPAEVIEHETYEALRRRLKALTKPTVDQKVDFGDHHLWHEAAADLPRRDVGPWGGSIESAGNSWPAGGGCAAMAIAMQNRWSHLGIKARFYDDHGRKAIDHAYAHDGKRAYDIFGNELSFMSDDPDITAEELFRDYPDLVTPGMIQEGHDYAMDMYDPEMYDSDITEPDGDDDPYQGWHSKTATHHADMYPPYLHSRMRPLAQISRHADKLAEVARSDLLLHGGHGHNFRANALALGIPGLGPRQVSNAWLHLAPQTSNLAIINPEIAEMLGEDYPGLSNRDYFRAERQLAAGRDASGYGHIPLGAFSAGMYDLYTGGPGWHPDRTPFKAYAPLPHGSVDWNTQVPPMTGFDPNSYWWNSTQQARDDTAKQFDREVGVNYPRDEVPFQKTAMAERSGFPELDQAIEEFMQTGFKSPNTTVTDLNEYRDPEGAYGNCEIVAQACADFLKARGFNAYVTSDDLGAFEGYDDAQDSAAIGAGDFSYPEHAVVEVYGMRGPNNVNNVYIDFTASQYGFTEFPKVHGERLGSTTASTGRSPWVTNPSTGERLTGAPGASLMQHVKDSFGHPTVQDVWNQEYEVGKGPAATLAKVTAQHSLWFKPNGRNWGKGVYNASENRLITWPENENIEHYQMISDMGWMPSLGQRAEGIHTLDITPDGTIHPRGQVSPATAAAMEAVDPRLAVLNYTMPSAWRQAEPGTIAKVATEDQFKDEPWKPGEQAHFEYHCHRGHDSSDADLWYRSHQPVTILGPEDTELWPYLDGRQERGPEDDWILSQKQRMDEGMPLAYRVRFTDGHEGQVMEDELYSDPREFRPEGGPPPLHEIRLFQPDFEPHPQQTFPTQTGTTGMTLQDSLDQMRRLGQPVPASLEGATLSPKS